MLRPRRRQAIVEFLAREGSGSVARLSALFDVSEMTIRRDLNELEQQSLIQRIHGGAIYVGPVENELPLAMRAVQNQELKKRIARYTARHLVKPHSVIALEGGTTAACLAAEIVDVPGLTILTNGLLVAANLATLDSDRTVLVSGGIMRSVVNTLVGPLTASFFQQYNAEIAFFSAMGLTLEHGFTDAVDLESQAKKDMRRAAQKTCVLLDSTKFGTRALKTTFTIDEVDILVTDAGAPADILDELEGRGVEVHIAHAPEETRGESA